MPMHQPAYFGFIFILFTFRTVCVSIFGIYEPFRFKVITISVVKVGIFTLIFILHAFIGVVVVAVILVVADVLPVKVLRG